MRNYKVSAVVLVVLLTAAFTGMASAAKSDNAGGANGGHNGDRPDDPGSFYLNQSVNFGERVTVEGVGYGIYMDGSLFEVDTDYTNPAYPEQVHAMYSEDVVVQADWSDNLVLHQWRAGDKVRTEVILQDIVDPSITVYTICATFKIEQVNPETGAVIDEVWYGTTYGGLWVDGPTDAYSAEINQVGNLLYGYNWDTGGLLPGQYRLTFELVPVDMLTYADSGIAVDYNSITIDGMVDPGMYGEDENYSLLAADYSETSTMIEITLLPR